MKSITSQRADILRRHDAKVIKSIVNPVAPDMKKATDLRAVIRERKARDD